jgi:hypothetical protein
MAIYTVSGITVATAATAEHAVAELWNPHSTKSIFIRAIELGITAATAANPGIRRSSAKGTAGSTVTVAREHDMDYGAAPDTGTTLELSAFSVQPTLIGTSSATSSLFRWPFAAAIGAGFMQRWSDPGMTVPPGAGVCVVTSTAIAFPISFVTFEFRD